MGHIYARYHNEQRSQQNKDIHIMSKQNRVPHQKYNL
jgi:hypothetical protein